MFTLDDQIKLTKDFNDVDYGMLTLFYSRLLSDKALKLYMIYHECIVNGVNINAIAQLVELSNVSLAHLNEAHKELANYLLVKTYQSNDKKHYLIKLLPPLSLSNFLTHEVLGRLWGQKINGPFMENLVKNITNKIDTENYHEVENEYYNLVSEAWSTQKEQVYTKIKDDYHYQNELTYQFDFDKLLGDGFEIVWPVNKRSDKQLSQIANIANTYGLDVANMRKVLVDCISLEGDLDINLLKEKAAKTSRISHVKTASPYELPPVQFLRKKFPQTPVSQSDKQIIDLLLNKFHFSNEVSNALLEYVLLKSKGKLVFKFVESVASSWSRASIDSLAKAKKYVEEDSQYSHDSFNLKLEEEVKSDQKAERRISRNKQFKNF